MKGTGHHKNQVPDNMDASREEEEGDTQIEMNQFQHNKVKTIIHKLN